MGAGVVNCEVGMVTEQTEPSLVLLYDMRTMTYRGKVSLPVVEVEARNAKEAKFKVLELALEQLLAFRIAELSA